MGVVFSAASERLGRIGGRGLPSASRLLEARESAKG